MSLSVPNINFIFYLFLINYSFTMYELASVMFPLNEHVRMVNFLIRKSVESFFNLKTSKVHTLLCYLLPIVIFEFCYNL